MIIIIFITQTVYGYENNNSNDEILKLLQMFDSYSMYLNKDLELSKKLSQKLFEIKKKISLKEKFNLKNKIKSFDSILQACYEQEQKCVEKYPKKALIFAEIILIIEQKYSKEINFSDKTKKIFLEAYYFKFSTDIKKELPESFFYESIDYKDIIKKFKLKDVPSLINFSKIFLSFMKNIKPYIKYCDDKSIRQQLEFYNFTINNKFTTTQLLNMFSDNESIRKILRFVEKIEKADPDRLVLFFQELGISKAKFNKIIAFNNYYKNKRDYTVKVLLKNSKTNESIVNSKVSLGGITLNTNNKGTAIFTADTNKVFFCSGNAKGYKSKSTNVYFDYSLKDLFSTSKELRSKDINGNMYTTQCNLNDIYYNCKIKGNNVDSTFLYHSVCDYIVITLYLEPGKSVNINNKNAFAVIEPVFYKNYDPSQYMIKANICDYDTYNIINGTIEIGGLKKSSNPFSYFCVEANEFYDITFTSEGYNSEIVSFYFDSSLYKCSGKFKTFKSLNTRFNILVITKCNLIEDTEDVYCCEILNKKTGDIFSVFLYNKRTHVIKLVKGIKKQ